MKLAAKYKAIQKMKNKKANLVRQIEVFQNSLSNITDDIEQSEADLTAIQTLLGELELLEKKKAPLVDEMNRLLSHFNAIEWRADLPYEDTIASSNFSELSEEVSRIDVRIREIPKEVNKVYYRR